MNTTTCPPLQHAISTSAWRSREEEREIPKDLLSALLAKASQQVERSDYITQDDMERLAALW